MLFLITILQSNSKQYSISYQNEAQRCSAQRTFTYLSIYLCPKKVQQLNFQFEGTGRHKEKPEERKPSHTVSFLSWCDLQTGTTMLSL